MRAYSDDKAPILGQSTHDIFHGVGIVFFFFIILRFTWNVKNMLKVTISFFAIFGLKKVFTLGSIYSNIITLTTFLPKSPNMKHSCERVSSNLLTFEGDIIKNLSCGRRLGLYLPEVPRCE